MPFGTWWRGDSLPALPSLPTFSAHLSTDTELLTRLSNSTQQEINARIQRENAPYIAFIGEEPVAYGWVTMREGGITELHFSFSVAAGNCYLWDFQTLPAWRGRGIYSHLLQDIIHQNQHVDRFWIGFAPGNEASHRGIRKAGFHVVGDFVVEDDHVSGLTLFDTSKHAQASAAFLQLPIVKG